MKKILSILTVVAMTISLLAACVTAAPKAPSLVVPPPVVEKTYNVEIINETTNIAVAIICIMPYPPSENEECVAMNIVVVPQLWIDKLEKDRGNSDFTSKQTVSLRAGAYIFFMAAYNLNTGETDKSYSIFTVDDDGELVFHDKRIDVLNEYIFIDETV